VGGSRKHGGADLGPTRAKASWLKLSVDGRGIADHVPNADTDIDHLPRLTLRMVARLQGFSDEWAFIGKKTSTYRQIGNAFPPPVARALGTKIADALLIGRKVAVSNRTLSVQDR
jgi:DNA (cytosine-5)-methyltransferase 1